MMQTSPFSWQEPGWREQAIDWIEARTRGRSIQITGEIQQPHIYAWSTVLQVPTEQGMLYFKATAPETLYEAALTDSLARWFPGCLPEFVAVDTARGWMLMRDGGEPLRASVRSAKDIAPWGPVMERYAELQIGLARHTTELLSLRVPDHRLSVLPGLWTGLLDDRESMMIDKEKGLTSADWRQAQEKVPRLAQICADLAAFGIPESLDHGDFHDGNILLRDDRITFFDWGDASVTHPFTSLRTLFVSMEIALDLEDYTMTPEMDALLDIYLRPFEQFASREALRAAHRLSRPVASVVKALAWHQGISRMSSSVRQEYAWIVPELIREFLHHEATLSAP